MNWMSLVNHVPALPEVLLLAGTCVVMIADLRVKSERRTGTYAIAQCVLLLCALATLFIQSVNGVSRLYLFNGLFVSDAMSNILKLTAYAAVSTALVYSRQYMLDRGLFKGEFVTLLLFGLLGMMVMISANSFLTLYLGLELLSLCLYAMVALNRDSTASTEAAMKYFVLGALASGLLLYGMSMIYGATGTLTITDVAKQVGRLSGHAADHTFLVFGLVFVVAGLAFKLGVVPFHMWIPDVYHGAPTAVTLVIGSGPKLAAFAITIRLLVNGLLDLAADWQQMLMVLSVLSMALGNIAAIAQTNLKRMLAYSTIAHMGFMLLGLMSGVVGGNWLNKDEAYAASMFYTMIYVMMSLGAFGMLLYLSNKGFECENLEDLKGLNADRRLLRQALGPKRSGLGRADLARGGRRDLLAHRRVLLPAHRQAHVLRRAARRDAGCRSRRDAAAALGERPRAARYRHRPAAAHVPVLRLDQEPVAP